MESLTQIQINKKLKNRYNGSESNIAMSKVYNNRSRIILFSFKESRTQIQINKRQQMGTIKN